jgi:hypothetical protein
MKEHYSKDPNKLRIAVEKSRKTIKSKYNISDLYLKIGKAQKDAYQISKNNLDKIDLLSKEIVVEFLKTKRDIFSGKGGSKKLLRDFPNIYKSLKHYCDEFKSYNYNRPLPFVCEIDIANNNFEISQEMLCRCGSIISFDRQTQNWDKFYCKNCRQSPTSIDHFKLKYGDDWELKWKEFRENLPVPRGKNETHLLDQLEKIYNTSIDRNFTVMKFFPDGYSKDLNIVYEVNEKHHRIPSHRKQDNMRRHMIQRELKCDFVVIWDDTYEIDIHKYDESKY